MIARHLEKTLELFPDCEIGSYPRYDMQEYRVMITLEARNLEYLNSARDYLLQSLDPEMLRQGESVETG